MHKDFHYQTMKAMFFFCLVTSVIQHYLGKLHYKVLPEPVTLTVALFDETDADSDL